MYSVVHIDEKWFNLYKASTKYYLAPFEEVPHRTCANKRYIGKVMFLAAIARPRYDYNRKQPFSGKLGIWPIVEVVNAARSSRNRPAGTPEMRNVTMDKARYKQFLLDKVFPAIREQWPGTTLYQCMNAIFRVTTDIVLLLYQYMEIWYY